MNQPVILVLATRINQQTAPALVEALKQHKDKPLEVDASAVTHIGTPGFEALLAAARSWQTTAVAFAITSPSHAFTEGLSHIGLAAEEFGIMEE